MSTEHPHLHVPLNWRPTEEIKPPRTYGDLVLHPTIIACLPISSTKIISSRTYGMSLWGTCAKIVAELPDGSTKKYFLKVASGENARFMVEGEFESVKAMNTVLPIIAPHMWTWGSHTKENNETSYFLIADFHEIGLQPPEPIKFTARLAQLHKNSISPTGKFGFHITTCHGNAPQLTDLWEDSWATLFAMQLKHMFTMDLAVNGPNSEYKHLCTIILNKVIPRLLLPLQSEGRSIKPCLVHGDCWDENTATDAETEESFIFDAGSFYAHNEYELGNWRAPPHRLSDKVYIDSYLREFPASDPVEDWDGRNLLYSLRFNTGTAIVLGKISYREIVIEDMKILIKTYCEDDWVVFEQGKIKHLRVKRGESFASETRIGGTSVSKPIEKCKDILLAEFLGAK